METVLVTGATGRIGKKLVPELIKRKYKVKALVRPKSTRILPKGVERIEFDLTSGQVPPAVFGGVDRVVHLAGLIGDHPSEKLAMNNTEATRNLISSIPTSVKKVVVASSISVYGVYKGELVDETYFTKFESPYGKSKYMAEMAARDSCGRINIVFLRFGMVYGPGFEEGYFSVFRLLEKGKMCIIGDGENRIPLLHVNDAVQAILLALERETLSCREYNIVGSEMMDQKGLLKLAADELGVPLPKRKMRLCVLEALMGFRTILSTFGIFPPDEFSLHNLYQLSSDRAYSCKRAADELGFAPKMRIGKGVREAVILYLKKKADDAMQKRKKK